MRFLASLFCLVAITIYGAVSVLPDYGSAIDGSVTSTAVTTNIGTAIWTNSVTTGTFMRPNRGLALWIKCGLTNVAGGTNNIGNCVITNEISYDGTTFIPLTGFKWEFDASSNTVGTVNEFIYTNYPAALFIGVMKWRVRTIDNTASNGLLINDFVWSQLP